MSDWEYHDIKIIGPEIELKRFCDLYTYKIRLGVGGFEHRLNNSESNNLDYVRSCYGEVTLTFSSKGKLIIVYIHAETSDNVDRKLIQKLQIEFPGLLFHSIIYFDYDMTKHFSFTKVKNGKVCKSQGVPIIDNVTIAESDKWLWYEIYEHSGSIIWLGKKLDMIKQNLRYLKLKEIEAKNE